MTEPFYNCCECGITKVSHPNRRCLKCFRAKRILVEQPDDPAIRHIGLGGAGGHVAIVDAADYEWLMQWKWFGAENYPGKIYVIRTEGRNRQLKMHREILGLTRGDDRIADHINGNTLDNRRCNLRIATNAQNGHNRGASSNNKAGFKGVSRNGNRWRAYIMVNAKSIYLGSHPTPEAAYAAYRSAAEKYHGEFARLL
jgi:hypothetical protein